MQETINPSRPAPGKVMMGRIESEIIELALRSTVRSRDRPPELPSVRIAFADPDTDLPANHNPLAQHVELYQKSRKASFPKKLPHFFTYLAHLLLMMLMVYFMSLAGKSLDL